MPFPGSRVDIGDKRYIITAKTGSVHDCFEFVDNERVEGPSRRFIETNGEPRYVWLDYFDTGYVGDWIAEGSQIHLRDPWAPASETSLLCQGSSRVMSRGAYLRVDGRLYEVEGTSFEMLMLVLNVQELPENHPARLVCGGSPYRHPKSRFDREIL